MLSLPFAKSSRLLSFRSTSLVAVLGLAALLAAPLAAQGDPQLKASALKKLNKAASSWVDMLVRYDNARPGKERRQVKREVNKVREKFVKELEKNSKKVDVMASLPDLQAIFANSIPYDRERGSGQFKAVRDMDDPRVPKNGFGVVVPKDYRHTTAMPLILSLPTRLEDKWEASKNHFESVWDGSARTEDSIIAIPDLEASLDFDTMIAADATNGPEVRRNRKIAVLGTAVGVRTTFRVDYDRIFLDCGKGSSFYGVRFATYSPQFLAGLILRDPQTLGDQTGLGSMKGLPVLLISSPNTKSACDELKAKLDALQPGSCTVLEASDAYPFKGEQAEIDAWVAKQRRNIAPTDVLVQPNMPTDRNAYWVRLGVPEPIQGVPVEARPIVRATADRASNRIKIDAKGVSDVTLQLNDALVDLSKPFTVELNGKASEHKLDRNLEYLIQQLMRRQDPGWIWTAQLQLEISN